MAPNPPKPAAAGAGAALPKRPVLGAGVGAAPKPPKPVVAGAGAAPNAPPVVPPPNNPPPAGAGAGAPKGVAGAAAGAPKPVVPVAPNAGAGAGEPNALVVLAPPPNRPPPAGAGAGDPKGLSAMRDEKENENSVKKYTTCIFEPVFHQQKDSEICIHNSHPRQYNTRQYKTVSLLTLGRVQEHQRPRVRGQAPRSHRTQWRRGQEPELRSHRIQ